jgi:hypothetical protein
MADGARPQFARKAGGVWRSSNVELSEMSAFWLWILSATGRAR